MSVPGYIAGDKGGELRVPRLGEKGRIRIRWGFSSPGRF